MKRILCLTLALTLALALCACGSTQTEETLVEETAPAASDPCAVKLVSSAVPDDNATHPDATAVKTMLEAINRHGSITSPYDSSEGPVRITKVVYSGLKAAVKDCTIFCDITYEGDYFSRVDSGSYLLFTTDGADGQWDLSLIHGIGGMDGNFQPQPIEGTEFLSFNYPSEGRLLKDFKARMPDESVRSLSVTDAAFTQPTDPDRNGEIKAEAVMTYVVLADNGKNYTMRYLFDYMFLRVDTVEAGAALQGDRYLENTEAGLKVLDRGVEALFAARAETPQPKTETPATTTTPAATAPETEYSKPADTSTVQPDIVYYGNHNGRDPGFPALSQLKKDLTELGYHDYAVVSEGQSGTSNGQNWQELVVLVIDKNWNYQETAHLYYTYSNGEATQVTLTDTDADYDESVTLQTKQSYQDMAAQDKLYYGISATAGTPWYDPDSGAWTLDGAPYSGGLYGN